MLRDARLGNELALPAPNASYPPEVLTARGYYKVRYAPQVTKDGMNCWVLVIVRGQGLSQVPKYMPVLITVRYY